MRKAFMVALLAASAAMPATAMAQDGENWRGRAESRQQNRAERQQARQENQAARQQARQQRQQARQEQPRQEARQERAQQSGEGWLGNPNDPRMEAHRRRYERLDRQNARNNGTQEQYRALVEQQRSQREARREDRRDDRQDWRQDRREDRRDNRQDWRSDRRDWRQDNRDDRREWRQDNRNDRREWRQDNRQDRRNWNRGWRNDNRYDWQRYRNSNRFVFRVQPYYAPYRGYGYNRFGIGQILDRLFWGRNYWISDPWQYRLPPAPYGYQWVRYYNDVVLVDTYNGEIVDVIHDFFW